LHERFRPFQTIYDQKSSETVVNRLETARDVKKRSRTFRNGEQSGTLDGLKRLKNHIDFLKTKELLYKNRILSFESIKLTRVIH
jgi:hypothetical protein